MAQIVCLLGRVCPSLYIIARYSFEAQFDLISYAFYTEE